MEQFCKDLPKIELHAHLGGSLSAKTLLSLGCQNDSISYYQKLTGILNKSSRTLEECFDLFQVAHKATQNTQSLYEAVQGVIADFYADNVIYLELRTTPRNTEHMTMQEYIETVVKAIKNSKVTEIIVKVIICIDRKFDQKTALDVVEITNKLSNVYCDVIAGFDLCGNPNVGTFPKEVFDKIRHLGFKITLHCGEVDNFEEIKQMLSFKPDRIGHGTFIPQSFGFDIPLEVCMTSNIVCGTVKDYKAHHVKMYLEKNMPFCLCTDDKGVFCCDLSHEYLKLHENFHQTPEQLWELSLKSTAYAFCTEAVKDSLREHLLKWKLENKTKHFFK